MSPRASHAMEPPSGKQRGHWLLSTPDLTQGPHWGQEPGSRFFLSLPPETGAGLKNGEIGISCVCLRSWGQDVPVCTQTSGKRRELWNEQVQAGFQDWGPQKYLPVMRFVLKEQEFGAGSSPEGWFSWEKGLGWEKLPPLMAHP